MEGCILRKVLAFLVISVLLKTVEGGYANVARGKPCEQSSFHNELYNKASYAVNGNINGEYTPNGTNCIHTKGELYNWWQVNLTRPHPVRFIDLWARDGRYVERMSRVVIKVDGRECYSFGEVNKTHARKFEITCKGNTPIEGTVVRLEKRSTLAQTELALNFCEIEILSCADGYWGNNCDKACPGQCAEFLPCDKITGFCDACEEVGKDPKKGCLEPCSNSTYGKNCSLQCGEGCTADCDPVTGTCDCKPGWKPRLCQEECNNGTYGQECANQCPDNCAEFCDKVLGNCTCKPGWQGFQCVDKCPSGTYGWACNETCGRCLAGEVCEPISGNCTICQDNFELPLCKTCKNGTYGPNCDLLCSPNCADACQADGKCNCKHGWRGPNCTQICPDGRYGYYCTQTCSTECTNLCDKETGACNCNPGFKFPTCSSRCAFGTYGLNCSGTCGSCKNNAPCDRVNGTCQQCKDLHVMPLCQKCEPGLFGTDCEKNCSVNCAEPECEKETGNCPCKSGWKPPDCKEKCTDGTFGPSCEQKCGNCNNLTISATDGATAANATQTCHPDTGACYEGCQPGFRGEQCMAALVGETGGDAGTAAGAAVGAILVILLVIFILIIVMKRRGRTIPLCDSRVEAVLDAFQAWRNKGKHKDEYKENVSEPPKSSAAVQKNARSKRDADVEMTGTKQGKKGREAQDSGDSEEGEKKWNKKGRESRDAESSSDNEAPKKTKKKKKLQSDDSESDEASDEETAKKSKKKSKKEKEAAHQSDSASEGEGTPKKTKNKEKEEIAEKEKVTGSQKEEKKEEDTTDKNKKNLKKGADADFPVVILGKTDDEKKKVKPSTNL